MELHALPLHARSDQKRNLRVIVLPQMKIQNSRASEILAVLDRTAQEEQMTFGSFHMAAARPKVLVMLRDLSAIGPKQLETGD